MATHPTQPVVPPSSGDSSPTFPEALERVRTRLLDLTLSNRLVNFRHTKRSSLRVVDELPDVLWNRLRDGDELLFVPVPEPPVSDAAAGSRDKPAAKQHAEALGLASSFDLPAPPAPGDKPKAAHRDNKIQTLLYPSDLDACLRTIASAARSAVEETGTNMLHLVFGFLDWTQADAPDKRILAPLLTLPVTLRRGDVDPRTRTYRFHVAHSGEEVAANLSLQEKLRRDFGIHLPVPEEDETPEAFFSRVEQAVAPVSGWRVRRQITLSLLSFGKLLMYRDFDPGRWPAGAGPLDHPRVRELFEGAERGPYDVCQEYPLDDEVAVPDLPPVVLDADSSQHSAMVDVLRGRNVVIQGPPGTGKSQTIANLIAAAMIRGKTVLFVAEKLAALEVVRRRLDDVGLGCFCLELHSHKTQRHRLLQDIAARLELRGSFEDDAGLDERLRLVADTRRELRAHAERLHADAGALGWSVFEVIWGRAIRAAQLDRLAAPLRDTAFPDPSEWSLAALEDLRVHVDAYTGHVASIRARAPRTVDHPWAGVTRPPEASDESRAIDMLGGVVQQAETVSGELASLMAETGVSVPASRTALDPWLHEVAYLSSLRGVQHPELLVRLADPASLAALGSFCDALDAADRLAASLGDVIPQPGVVDEATLSGAREAASVLASAAATAPTLGDVDAYVGTLDGIRRRLAAADTLRARVSQLLSCEVPATLGGLSATAEIVALAQSAPFSLLHLRAPVADPEATEHAFRSALAEAQSLWEQREALSQRFDLELLPSVGDLKRYGGACATAGTFRFLSSEYQAARQCYGSFSRSGAPDDPKTLSRDLLQLASYRARLDAFSTNPDYQRVIGPAFRGMDTPFRDVSTVRAWQLCVTQTLSWALPSARSLADRIAAAPAEILRGLASLVPDAANERNALQNAVGGLQASVASARGGTPASQELSVGQAVQMLDGIVAQLRSATGRLRAIGFVSTCPTARLVASLDGLAALSHHRQSLASRAEVQALIGPVFQGAATPAAPLRSVMQLAQALSQSHLPEALRVWLRDTDLSRRVEVLLNRTQRILAAVRQLDAVHDQLFAWLGIDAGTWYRGRSGWGREATAEQVAHRAAEARDHADQLPAWRGMLRARSELEHRGLGDVLRLLDAGTFEPEALWDVCELLVYDRLAARALARQPALAAFDGMAHQALRERFRRYDLDTVEAYRKRAAHLVDRRAVPEGVRTGPVAAYTELGLLEHECGKQRRHVGIRQLVRRAGHALQALTPCFMMGPRAVAQYLEPGALSFDIVVMDEASQLRPEDAVGAVCRGRQVAVIGDPLQLPPTSFFDRLADPDEVDEQQATTFDDAESILDVASSVYSPVRRLRWHYRSRHESLIAFSNEAFYEGRLVVFPSPRTAGPELGLRFELVEGAVYQAGLNETEARRVVDAVVEHVKTSPERSLGVVAMNFKQRDRIEELLYARLKDDDALRETFERLNGGVEPLFVKNLENVQGDERDVIFVSVTYGKGPDGRLLRRFGPLNGAAGPRRLNVLFTRSKRRLVVFASFEPEDLDLGEGASEGALTLKRYLTHARDRTRTPPDWRDQTMRSDCERALARALAEHGYEVVPRVGVAGTYVDVAVRDPEDPREFLLGIEVDGPDYVRSHSTRDSDRLRPAGLANLGWRLFSLWSVDYWRDPDGTLHRILDAIERARREAAAGPGAG